MAQQLINIGLVPNDKSGDLIRTAFNKVNENFTELYSSVAADIQIPTQTNNAEKLLSTDGVSLRWVTLNTETHPEIRDTYETIPAETPTIVWSSQSGQFISTVKLIINIEALEVGGDGQWHTQSCEAIIANRVFMNNADPAMTVYGLTYTSVNTLATFTVQRNFTTQQIEVVATSNNLVVDGAAYAHIYSTELLTAD